ncbi:MAG: CRTAC1 family protein [Candidatus Limnocylindrales bacterium]
MSTPRGISAGPRRPWLALGGLAAIVIVGGGLAVVGAPWTPQPLVVLGPPHFVEEAAIAGVVHTYDGDSDFFVGGGVAAFDCDDDDRVDLYAAGGSGPASLFRNLTAVGGTLRFERLAAPETDLESVIGAYPLDLDGDGHADLVVLRHGGVVVLRGLGDCHFERANEALGLDGGDGWTTAFSASWEDPSARLPTLAFGEYVQVADTSGAFSCPDGRLVRPVADGATYGPPIALSPGWCPLSMLFSDWDRSGRRDLRISNDRNYYRDGEEQLWRIAAGEAPRLYTQDDGWARLQIWGMGIASRDVTADGLPDVYLTSQGDNKLQTLSGGAARPAFEDIALSRGATAHRPFAGDDVLPSTAWHPAFEDVNNDGLVDLFVSKGNVEAQAEHAMDDPSNLLIGQLDGSYVESAVAAGLLDMASARGAALVDLNRDGLLDLVKVVRRDHLQIWRNVGAGDAQDTGAAGEPRAMGRWLGIQLNQDAPNRDAVGAWIAVRVGDRTTEREVTVGGGHVSGTQGPLHFGLGSASSAEVRVTWPDGEVGPWMRVEADRFVRLVRGATAPEVRLP